MGHPYTDSLAMVDSTVKEVKALLDLPELSRPDNEITWIDWDLGEQERKLLEFTSKMVGLRRDHPVLRRRRFFTGRAGRGGESERWEIEWLRPSGEHMTNQD